MIVGPSWIGDMVMAEPMMRQIKSSHPGSSITLVAPSWSLDVASRMISVDHGVVSPFQHRHLGIWKRYGFAKGLRAQKFQKAWILPNSFKSALLPYWAHVPNRIGFLGEHRYGLLTDIRRLNEVLSQRLVDQYYSLAFDKKTDPFSLAPFPRLFVNKDHQIKALLKFGLEVNRPILVMCPGAEYGPAKQWPIHYYIDVARHFVGMGWQIWWMGSAKDTAIGHQDIETLGKNSKNLCGKTNLVEAVDLMGCARLVLSNDSGLMHVASALDRPLVAIYGSSDPNKTPPLSSKVFVFYLGLECSPCFKRVCPLGHTRCLVDIRPGDVTNELIRLDQQYGQYSCES